MEESEKVRKRGKPSLEKLAAESDNQDVRNTAQDELARIQQAEQKEEDLG